MFILWSETRLERGRMRLTDYDKLQLKLREYADRKASNGEIELANGILKAKCFIDQECTVIEERQLNNGWIPVSERLPNEEECNLYDVTHPCHRKFMCTVKVGNYEPQTRKLFFYDIFGWKYGLGDYNEYVMAWQPLLEPYQPE